MDFELLGTAARNATRYALTLGFAAALFLCVRLCWQWRGKSTDAKLPPGPRGIPLLGNLAFLSRDFYRKECMEWAKKYGPVFRIKLGAKNIVMVNDFESIKDVLCKKECLFRPKSWIFKDVGGFASLNGKSWQENRRFCMKVLRTLTSGEQSMVDRIREEFQHLRDKVAEANGHPIMIRRLLRSSMSNNLAALMLNSRYQSNDPNLQMLQQHVDSFEEIFINVPLVHPLPGWLNWISRFSPFLGGGKSLKFVQQLIELVRHGVDHHLDNTKADAKRHFIDGYRSMITQHSAEPDLNFNTRTLHGNVIDLLVAGSSSVAITVLWAVLKCAENPDTVQAKVQAEIDKVVGHGRTSTWEDHHSMPYTMAVIREILRWKTINALNLPREVEEDVFLNGYLIPKGTIVIANLWAVHSDTKYWDNPEEFNPSRFLTQDESALLPRPEHLIPFSIGKRMCPGMNLANVEIFLCLTTLLQKFRILIDKDGSFNAASDQRPDLLAQGLHFLPRLHK